MLKLAPVLTLILSLACGCKHDAKVDVISPRATVLAFWSNVYAGKIPQALTFVEGAPQAKANAQTLAEFTYKVYRLRTRLNELYGPSAWEAFNDDDHMKFTLQPKVTMHSLQKEPVNHEGRIVFVGRTRLIKVKGQWRLDGEIEFANNAAEDHYATLRQLLPTIDEIQAKAEEKEMSVDSLDKWAFTITIRRQVKMAKDKFLHENPDYIEVQPPELQHKDSALLRTDP